MRARVSRQQPPAGQTSSADFPTIGWPVWRLAWVIVFGAFAAGMDASLANIGLETIATDLDTSLDHVQWVSNGYLLALAVSLPSCAWLSRTFGTGRLWLFALLVFTVTSGLCAMAWNIELLIVLRVAQGLSAGVLIPAGQTILGQAVGPERLGRVMSILGIVVSLAPALGPVFGGLVLAWWTWPWLFLINVPIGIAGLIMGLRLVPRGSPEPGTSLDRLGFAYIGVSLPLLVYGLTRWGAGAPIGEVLIPLAGAGFGLGLFVHRSWTSDGPLLDLRLHRNPVFAAASAAAGSCGALLFGSTLIYPLYFQVLHGDSTIITGLRVLCLGGGTAAVLPIAGRLTDRYGGGVVSVCGSLAAVAATLPFAFLPAASNVLVVQALLVVLGMATAFAAIPTSIAAYKTVRPDQLPDATAQVNILQRLGGSIGGALFAVVIAGGLSAGSQSAFQSAFAWQTGAAAVTLVASFWLFVAQLRSTRNLRTAKQRAGR